MMNQLLSITKVIPDTEKLFNLMIPQLTEWANKKLKEIKSDYPGGGRDKYYPKEVSKIYYEDGNIRIEIDLNLVAKCIEFGRSAGKMPPRDAILKWIKIKHIVPRLGTSIPQLAFLICRSIGKHGTEGKYYIYNKLEEDGELPDVGDVLDAYFESYDMLTKLD